MVVNGELRELQESRIEKNFKSQKNFLRVIRIVKNPTQCLKITP